MKKAIALSEIDNPKKEYIACTVCLKKTNEIIGSVGCSFYKDLDEVGITYFIGEKYRGNGYAVESVKAYTDYFFSHYQIKKLIATIREENVASVKYPVPLLCVESRNRLFSFAIKREKLLKLDPGNTELLHGRCD